jgi:hypothetical protein
MTPSRNLMSSVTGTLVLVILTSVVAAPVWGQTLGKAARDAEAKRKTTSTSGKVYTNGDLRGDPSSPSQPGAPTTSPTTAAAPPSQSGVAPADEKAKDGQPAKDEAYWRQRIKAERDALSRAETFSAALQSQISGLHAEFAACAGPPQCNEISSKRQKSSGELDRVKKEIADRTKAVVGIQEEARRAGVPAGWVR